MSLSKSLCGSLDLINLPRFVPYNGKIADITEADTNKHTLDLAAALGETRKIVKLIVSHHRTLGTGNLLYYPNEGAQYICNIQTFRGYHPITVFIAKGSQRLQYSQDTANDAWELWCHGYLVEA